MTVVVPMAGRGSRFADNVHLNPEYKKPKPLINIKGKPMVLWAIESLPFVHLPHRPSQTDLKVHPSNLIFICRKDHQEEFGIVEQLKKIFTKDIKTILLDSITRGASETALKAKHFIDQDDDILISDSDHHFDATELHQAIINKHPDTVGIIPVFPPPYEEIKWSYTLFDKNFIAQAVAEKDPDLAKRGAYANIGGYYFSKGSIFVKEAEQMIEENDMYGPEGKQEFYLAPIYNRLIKKGMRVAVAVIPQVWGLGTPKDVEYFENNFN